MGLILLISIVLIIFGFLKPKSQISTIALFLFMWLLMGWNTGNPDFENYLIRFNRFSNLAGLILAGITDPGFSIINIFFNSLGFDFYQSRIIISFICLYFVYSTIQKYSLYPAFVSVFYFVFIFALDVTQFRNFVAYSIVIFAIRFLFQKGSKGIIIFSALILIASSIHSACLFYLILVLSRSKINLKIILILLVIVFLVKSVFYKYYALTLDTDKLTDRYQQGISIIALLSVILVQALNAVYINIYKPFVLNKSITTTTYNYRLKKKLVPIGDYYTNIDDILELSNSNIIPIISLLLLLLIPFYVDNMTYSRIFRNIVILNFIYLSNHNLSNPFKSITINNILLLVYGLFFFFYYFIYVNGWNIVIQPILSNNSIFN